VNWRRFCRKAPPFLRPILNLALGPIGQNPTVVIPRRAFWREQRSISLRVVLTNGFRIAVGGFRNDEVICPSGKSANVVSRTASLSSSSAKIFVLRCRANHRHFLARLAPDQEGRFAIVTNVGCGMRWTQRCAQTRRIDADGEVVWS
jgi:hypothetical protein